MAILALAFMLLATLGASVSATQQEGFSFVIDPETLTSGGLVGYWKFDEGSGGVGSTTSDASGYANHGTIHSAASFEWVVSEISGMAINFNDDYVEVDDSPSLDVTDGLTITAWVKLADPSADQKIVGKAFPTPQYSGYVLGVQNNQLYPEIWDSAGTHYVSRAGTINPGEWTHLAVTWQRGGVMIGYINGDEVERINASPNPIGTNSNPLRMGCAPWDTTQLFVNGVIDEVRIYSRALGPSEIAELAGQKSATSITISADKTVVRIGETVTFSGSLVDETGAGVGNKRLDVYRNDTMIGWVWTAGEGVPEWKSGVEWGSSADDGRFAFSPTPSLPGAYNHYVEFPGDADYEMSRSNTATVTVTKQTTSLSVSPSSFTVESNQTQALTATLTSGGSPLAGKTITWSVTSGSLSPSSGTTDASGQVTTTYTAPTVSATVTVTASFTGDISYESSSGSSSGTVIGPTQGLVGYWKFDEGSGPIAHDSSGNGNDGTINGATWVTGKYGGALEFNGSLDYVRVHDDSSLDITDEITVEAWVYIPQRPTTHRVVIAKYVWAQNQGYVLKIEPSSLGFKVTFALGNGGTTRYVCYNTSFTAGWFHLAGTYDGVTQKLYVNGNLVKNMTWRGSIATNNSDLFIGAESARWWHFDGVIDEVRVHNRALRADELAEPANQKSATSITISADKTVVGIGETVTFSGSLVDETGAGVGNKRLDAYRNDTWIGWVFTDSNGGISFIFTPSLPNYPPGTYNYYVKFPGDADYEMSRSNTITITVIKQTTSLSVSPSSFTIESNQTQALTATLTSGGSPLAGKTITWSATSGSLSPSSGTTDASGQVTVTYTAPTVSATVTVTASFAGDISYKSSSGSSSGTVIGPTQGLAGYWKFDEGSGFIAHDSSGYGNDGTVNGATWVPDGYGGALEFNSAERDYVRVRDLDSPSLDISDEITVAAWVYIPRCPTTHRVVIAKYVWAQNQGYVLKIEPSSLGFKVTFALGNGGATRYVCYNTSFTAGWWHLAGTYDGVAQKLYVNGDLVKDRTWRGSIATNNSDLFIGAESSAWWHFDGRIDEVRVYNYALGEDEIAELAGLVGYWKFDEGPGSTTTSDASGYGNNGTIHSAASFEWVNGISGKAINFNDDYVEVADSPSLDVTNELTMTAWVKLADPSADQKIVGKTPSTPQYSGYVMGVQNNQLYPEIWDSAGTHYVFRAGTINPNKWTHLAVTWQRGGVMIGYINGNEVERINASSNPIGTNSNPLRMGCAPWDVTQLFVNGVIDEARVYNCALGEEEIRSPFFTLTVSPSSGSVLRGESTTATVSVGSYYGYNQQVDLSVATETLPAGVSVTLDSVSGTPPFTSTLAISTTSSTPDGTYTITVTGTEGGISHSCIYFLTITRNKYAVLIARRTSGDAGFDEFWNDLKIMHDILVDEGYVDDGVAGFNPATDHIAMLYGDGNDEKTGKYGTPAGTTITDFSATMANIQSVFASLGNVMTDDDFLYVYTFDHGDLVDANGNGHWDLGEHVVLCVQDGNIQEDVFAGPNYLGQIAHYESRTIVMQQCHSGGFGFNFNLSNERTVIATACTAGELAWRCDDRDTNDNPIIECEVVNGTTYHHGEFSYHIMSALGGVDPQGTPVNADADGNGRVSMQESFNYAWSNDSRRILQGFEHPQFFDSGGLGGITYL